METLRDVIKTYTDTIPVNMTVAVKDTITVTAPYPSVNKKLI